MPFMLVLIFGLLLAGLLCAHYGLTRYYLFKDAWVYGDAGNLTLLMHSVFCSFFSAIIVFFDCLIPLVVFGVCVAGVVLLAANTTDWIAERPRRRSFLEANRTPRFQFQMLDLYVAVGFYGLSMCLALASKPAKVDATPYVLACAAWLLISQVSGMLIVVDAFRRTAGTLNASARAAHMVFMMFFSALALPLSLVAWMAWRSALWHRTPDWRG